MDNKKLWYRNPAKEWVEALPVGNGRLGAMVFGGAPVERLQLNEDTLWSGEPKKPDECNNPGARGILPLVREALFDADYRLADELCKKMQGPFNQNYLPLADLFIELDHGPEVDGYYRDLDLDSAVASTRYKIGGIQYERRVFASFPDQVIVVRLDCGRPGRLSFKVRISSPLKHSVMADSHGLVLKGRAPVHSDPNYHQSKEPVRYETGPDAKGMTFETRIKVLNLNGRISAEPTGLSVSAADSAVILVSAATSYNGPWKSPGAEGLDPSRPNLRKIFSAAKKPFDRLFARHLKDHRRLFRRVGIDLGARTREEIPTDERVRGYAPAADPGLEELLFHYGRYLLIASSRPGSQPANLQGIWNQEVQPPWSSNWTLNINTEMNYWPAEPANLPECHLPLLDFIAELAVNGRETARINFGARGWTAHHNADLWRQTAPVGDFGHGTPVWANWPMGSPWLCQHLWEHYAFDPDKAWLKKIYPIMKGAAEFCLDWLVEDGKGNLVTAPSVSPEQQFTLPDGGTASCAVNATMDTALIRDLFTNCLDASRILKLDDGFSSKLESAMKRMIPYRIGSRGQLQEWAEDFMEAEVHHRHVSHLFGLHPGKEIDPDTTPELSRACERTLEIRGDEGTGWSLGWKINLWARLRDGNHAYLFINNLLRPVTTAGTAYSGGGGVYPNLFDAHPPFQIDGNFAYTAGVAEMLLQSQNSELHLLPCLPSAWASGSVAGLRARNGFETSIAWDHGLLRSAEIKSSAGNPCRIRTRRAVVVRDRGKPVKTDQRQAFGDWISVFRTKKNRVYTVLPV